MLDHPVKESIAWQWVQDSFTHSNTAKYMIKLALKTDSSSSGTVNKRQAMAGTAFFADINIEAQEDTTPTDEDGQCVCVRSSDSCPIRSITTLYSST